MQCFASLRMSQVLVCFKTLTKRYIIFHQIAMVCTSHKKQIFMVAFRSVNQKQLLIKWYSTNTNKGPSIKDFRSQGVCLVQKFCGQGTRQMRTSHFLVQKTSDFSKFMLCPHGQGFEPVRTFFGKRGRGSIFCRRLLWTAPNSSDTNITPELIVTLALCARVSSSISWPAKYTVAQCCKLFATTSLQS